MKLIQVYTDGGFRDRLGGAGLQVVHTIGAEGACTMVAYRYICVQGAVSAFHMEVTALDEAVGIFHAALCGRFPKCKRVRVV